MRAANHYNRAPSRTAATQNAYCANAGNAVNAGDSKEPMKSVVTGGAGFIGSHLVDKLVSLGHEVVCIDNEFAAANSRFYWNGSASNHKVDVRDYAASRPLYEGADCVFHLAAESRVQPAIQSPVETVSINCVGTATVLQCALEAEARRFVYSSTSSAYGREGGDADGMNTETAVPNCLTPYSVSKVAGEMLCRVYHELYGLRTISLRYFNVYGDRQPLRGPYAPVIGLFLRQCRAGEPLTIVGDGGQQRDFTHVSDAVAANLAVALKEDAEDDVFGEIYNVGTGRAWSILDVQRMISSNAVHVPSRPGEARRTLADTRRLREAFGWQATVRLDAWLRQTLAGGAPLAAGSAAATGSA